MGKIGPPVDAGLLWGGGVGSVACSDGSAGAGGSGTAISNSASSRMAASSKLSRTTRLAGRENDLRAPPAGDRHHIQLDIGG